MNGDGSRVVRWENTNLLLNDSRVYGIKTGNTYTAGPCLCSAFEMKSHRIIVTVLNSKSLNRRWSEVIRLAEWALSQIEAVSLIMTKEQIKALKLSSLVRGTHNI
jgi:D-alanyl-D-alanine carboxypeptidase